MFKNIVCCHSEDNAPHHLKDVSFVKSLPDFENPENVPTLIVLDDLMDSAYSNPRDKTQIVHLARQVYPENIASFHKPYLEVCKDPHTYLFLDLTQSINDGLQETFHIYKHTDTN